MRAPSDCKSRQRRIVFDAATNRFVLRDAAAPEAAGDDAPATVEAPDAPPRGDTDRRAPDEPDPGP